MAKNSGILITSLLAMVILTIPPSNCADGLLKDLLGMLLGESSGPITSTGSAGRSITSNNVSLSKGPSQRSVPSHRGIMDVFSQLNDDSKLFKMAIRKRESGQRAMLSAIDGEQLNQMLSHKFRKLRPASERSTPIKEPLVNVANFEYIGECTVGTPPQKLKVLIDAGSSCSWCFSSLCKKKNCNAMRKYNSSKSTTAITNKKKRFATGYGSGNVKGFKTTDVTRIGGRGFTNAMAQVTKADPARNFGGFTCLFGMGWPSLCRSQKPFTYAFSKQNGFKNIVGIFLTKDVDKKGEMVFGGVNKELISGKISWTPIQFEDFWRLTLKRFTFGDLEQAATPPAVFDTGTSFLAIPVAFSNKMAKHIGAKAVGGGTYTIACGKVASLPDMTFTLGQKNYVLTPADYVGKEVHRNGAVTCYLRWFASDFGGSSKAWILGDPFMAAFYTVLDTPNKRIGLAHLK